MYKRSDLVLIRTFSPMHVGCGSDLGVVDLPVQREKHTGFPKVESTGLKGSIRQSFEECAQSKDDLFLIHNLFGFDAASRDCYSKDGKEVCVHADIKNAFDQKTQFAGAVGFTDVRILLFPVASAKGVFSYVTSYGVLKKFFEEAVFFGHEEYAQSPADLADLAVLNPKTGNALCSTNNHNDLNRIFVVSDYTYNKNESPKLDAVLDQLAKSSAIPVDTLKEKVLVVPDDDFKDFVTMSTEVITRTKIDDTTGTVAKGALFTEEYVPEETVLYAHTFYSPIYDMITAKASEKTQKDETSMNPIAKTSQEVRELYRNCAVWIAIKENESSYYYAMIQLGSGASIGKGLVKMILT